MTDPVIAPSFPEQLEQAADFIKDCTINCVRPRPLGVVNIDYPALLTRAAAIARAAEKVATYAEPLYIDGRMNGYRCAVCGAFKADTADVKHGDDCAWMQLRALVLTEGSGK